jgi:K+-transporting ATPase ATPase C chain
VDAVKARVDALKAADKDAGVVNEGPVPVDLVTASASGLDPHISPEAAAYQAARISKANGLSIERVDALITAHTEAPQWGFLGMPRVNVLDLNLAIDAAKAS